MMAIQMVPRFPHLDPHTVPDQAWRELPLTRLQATRVEETYRATHQRGWKHDFGSRCEGQHLWMRAERGPWVCEHCPEERWTL